MNACQYLFITAVIFLFFNSCQTKVNNGIEGLTIDKKVEFEVEKHIENSKEFDAFKSKMQVYYNTLYIESYENDSLIFDSGREVLKQPFKSFYFWRGDTLKIEGAFGLFTGVGFNIDIYKNKALLSHMLSSDELPNYAYKQKDTLTYRLEVPCTDTKIILSEIPDKIKGQIIYGYVEFKSNNYYTSGSGIEGKETSSRKKNRDNMKIYFKSSKTDL